MPHFAKSRTRWSLLGVDAISAMLGREGKGGYAPGEDLA